MKTPDVPALELSAPPLQGPHADLTLIVTLELFLCPAVPADVHLPLLVLHVLDHHLRLHPGQVEAGRLD